MRCYNDVVSGIMFIGIAISLVVRLEFAEDECQQKEGEGGNMIKVTVSKNVTLANPVTVRITPLTVQMALDRGIIATFESNNPYSPNRAGRAIKLMTKHNYLTTYIHTGPEDFIMTAINVAFATDENTAPVTNYSTFITIMDDEINEAGKQFFIVALEIVDAINMELIARGPMHNSASITCTILDNDGKTGFDRLGPPHHSKLPNLRCIIIIIMPLKELLAGFHL